VLDNVPLYPGILQVASGGSSSTLHLKTAYRLWQKRNSTVSLGKRQQVRSSFQDCCKQQPYTIGYGYIRPWISAETIVRPDTDLSRKIPCCFFSDKIPPYMGNPRNVDPSTSFGA
jgi:hypothetical protein